MSIELNGITVQYPSSPFPSLHNVCAHISNHTITLLIGMTGSGKSTLLDVISGLAAPTSGEVIVDKKPLWARSRPDKELMMKFGSVFQYPEHQLFANTVLGEFTYSLRPSGLKKAQILQRAKESLEYVHLQPTILKESPFNLSGGQKRRVALATTYSTKPDWLFLDEPTAGLDPDSVCQLISFIEDSKGDRCDGGIVIATHDLDVFLPIADEIILLSDGRMIRHIQTGELFEHPEWLTDIGIALPPSLALHTKLCKSGTDLPGRYMNPKEMAIELLNRPLNGHHAGEDKQPVAIENEEEVQDAVAYTKRGFSALDPRTKWILCLILSATMLVQTSLIGLLTSICITAGLLAWSHVDLQTIMRYTRPVLAVLLISIVLAALQFGHGFHLGPIHGFGLAAKPALTTLKGFIGFLCIVEIGLLLPATTSSQQMNQGLSQLLSPLKRLGLPIDAIALSASLLLRFIPMILQQLQRFARIAKARGKRSTRSGRIGIRDIPAVVIPLILAILKLGEDLSLAMEARGYKSALQNRTVLKALRMKQADYAALAGAVVMALLLTGLRILG